VQRLSALIVLLDGMEGRNWQLKFALVSFVCTFLLSCIIRLIKLYLVTCYDASYTTQYWTVVAVLTFNYWTDNCLGISGTFQFVQIWWREPRTSNWGLRDPSGSLLRFSTSPPASPLAVKVSSYFLSLCCWNCLGWLWLIWLIEFLVVSLIGTHNTLICSLI